MAPCSCRSSVPTERSSANERSRGHFPAPISRRRSRSSWRPGRATSTPNFNRRPRRCEVGPTMRTASSRPSRTRKVPAGARPSKSVRPCRAHSRREEEAPDRRSAPSSSRATHPHGTPWARDSLSAARTSATWQLRPAPFSGGDSPSRSVHSSASRRRAAGPSTSTVTRSRRGCSRPVTASPTTGARTAPTWRSERARGSRGWAAASSPGWISPGMAGSVRRRRTRRPAAARPSRGSRGSSRWASASAACPETHQH